MAVEKVTFASPQESNLTKKRTERRMLSASANTEPERHKPHPPDTPTIHSTTCAPGEQLPLPKPSNGTLPPTPPPPPPHSKQTSTHVTRTVNALLLQSACHLAVHSGPPDRPISLHDPLHPLLQALRRADEAHGLAAARRRFDLVAKAQLFRGHAYRAMGLWDLAGAAYVRAASHPDFAADRSEEGLEGLTRLCAEMRDGRMPSAGNGRRRRGVFGGLFRCGTFGDVERRNAGVSALKTPVGEEQVGVEKRMCERVRFVEDGEDGGDEKTAREDHGGGSDEDHGGGDGQVDVTDEGEIDWIAIGANDARRLGDPARRKVCRRSGYPLLRSARGRLLGRRKM